MYGVFSYLFLVPMHWTFPNIFPGLGGFAILKPSDIGNTAIDPTTIGFASFFGTLLGLCITENLNRQWLLRICRALGLTERFGDSDVWTLLLNSTDTDNYVTIRHKERKLVYQGYVKGFSGGGETRELLIINVRVFADSPPISPPTLSAEDTLTAESAPEDAAETTNSAEDKGLQEVGEIPFLYISFKDDDVILEFGQKSP